MTETTEPFCLYDLTDANNYLIAGVTKRLLPYYKQLTQVTEYKRLILI